ncbi:SNF2-family ATP dependent chromatin remodeling factor snf21 [Fistulina hepatica ATCC 64428]|uniref:SNF2-family ATP dependent chromatin remodeling factor snf21 n=1 Tax=Fistulina hepatica ATCC 64428 TaxID=1128425 RepID=A0A0D7A726_9AGAR|nr:SNF2-family ATP dependent chromatin remodeling factor snf21 [Fistulina hepatica ATCC 64428]
MAGPSPPRAPGDLHQVINRINFLRNNPTEQSAPGELEQLMRIVQSFSQIQRNQNAASMAAMPNTMNGSHPAHVQSTNSMSFTTEQMDVLRTQVHAFRLLQRGMPVPEYLQHAIRTHNTVGPDLEKLLHQQDTNAKIVDNAVKMAKGETVPAADRPIKNESPAPPQAKTEEPEIPVDPADLPKGPFMEDDVDSGIYPYNAYRHPFSHLKRPSEMDPKLFATRMQRLLVPTLMPTGLDAHQILAERDRFIEARIAQRIRELETLPSTMGDGGLVDVDDTMTDDKLKAKEEQGLSALLSHPAPNTHGKLRAIIELKALRLVDKQRQLRAIVAERLNHGSLLPINRVEFRRPRRPTVRDTRKTEKLEREQRVERERRAKHKHVAQLNVICEHGREVMRVNQAARDRVLRLARSVANFHAHTEKEEQKRIERISKERLRALKADDEEAYMKLIDTAKDTRITHLLKQTDAYLDSLAQAVVAQQSESGPVHDVHESEEGPASEATFGAQTMEDESAEEKGKVDYYAIAHRITEKVSRQPAILVGGTLKDYQLKGLQWMVSLYNNRLNGILADEMGLGKTIQTISLISYLIETKHQRGPYLVVVPLSTMTNWSAEFAKWAPSVRIIAYKGNPAQRRSLQNELRMGQFQVLLTTYEYIIKDRPHLSKMKWIHMIIDEGHRMKNTQSKLAQTLTTYYHSRYRLLLTGTPLQNNLPELWSLLNFALPRIFNSVKSFDEWFNTPFANSGTPDKIELNEEEALLIIRRLHKVLRPFLLRRLKKDVESELPDKLEKVIKVRMSALQSQLYKQMKKFKMIAAGQGTKGKGTNGVKGLSNELMQLRKICQHPYLFESVEDNINPTGMIDEKIVRSSGKVELLNRILPKLFATGHRVLIFFQMTKVMDIMEDFLRLIGVRHLRLDGGTKTEERAQFVQMFNATDSEYKVFILSTRAGGLGLNLQSADTVIIFDSDWNPHADLQAQDRAHRIGQTKAVLILRFITEKSVEEAMYQRARYKLDIDGKVIQAGRFDNKSTQEEQEEFLRSILEADQEEENEEAGDMTDEELNQLLARQDGEAEIYNQMDIEREREVQGNWIAAGNTGKPPPPLIQLEELPECYRTDEPFVVKEDFELVEGRGQRKRTVVSYNDGLSDDAWAMAVEEGEDLEELAERARRRERRRVESARETPLSDAEVKPRQKGRKGKNKAIPDYEADEAVTGKRKRGGGSNSISVTPSINGDDDDEPVSKRRKKAGPDNPPAVRDRMKAVFAECYRTVTEVMDDTGRKRCDLFRDPPSKRDYPDYYQVIKKPIALSTIRKRQNSNHYKTVQMYRDDWKLMFQNAYTYNQEGSWVFVDAQELQKVFEGTFNGLTLGSGLPGAASGDGDVALTPMDDDERLPPTRNRSHNRKQIISDEEYLTTPGSEY